GEHGAAVDVADRVGEELTGEVVVARRPARERALEVEAALPADGEPQRPGGGLVVRELEDRRRAGPGRDQLGACRVEPREGPGERVLRNRPDERQVAV